MQEDYEAIGKELVRAAAIHYLCKVKELVKKGADVNYVVYTNSNSWYRGDSHTPLSSAIDNPFTNQSDYINIIAYLLSNGANLNFQTTRGIYYNKFSMHKIQQKIPQQISKFKNVYEKIRLIKILIKYGLDINHVEVVDQKYLPYREDESYCMKLVRWNGLGSRIKELEQMQCWSVDKPKVIWPQPTNDTLPQNHGSKQQENNKFIEFLIQAGMDPKCYRSTLCRKINSQNGHLVDKTEVQTYENIMHCAISNNNLPIVTKLLQHKHPITTKCTLTITTPFHPSQWPAQLQQQQQNKNRLQLKRLQKQKSILKLELTASINGYVPYIYEKITCQSIQSIEGRISEIKKYSLENAKPIWVRSRRQIDCLQLAECFGVDGEIVRVIQNAMREQNELKKENVVKIKQIQINE